MEETKQKQMVLKEINIVSGGLEKFDSFIEI